MILCSKELRSVVCEKDISESKSDNEKEAVSQKAMRLGFDDKYKLEHIITGDILVEALNKKYITEDITLGAF